MNLSKKELNRYNRHILLPEISVEGQKKICNSSVLIIGIGGLGSPCCLYLCTCGISILGLMDFDKVEETNLHRQVIHQESHIGMNKAKSAKIRCENLNSLIKIQTYEEKLTSKNAMEILKDYDVIVDCTDNVVSRYLINDACVFLNKPLVSGSCVRFDGQLTVYNYSEKCPCYRCLFPKPPSKKNVMKCSEYGVLGVVPGIIGCLQALEVQKIILKLPNVLAGKLLLFNGKICKISVVKLREKKSNCVICGKTPIIKELKEVIV